MRLPRALKLMISVVLISVVAHPNSPQADDKQPGSTGVKPASVPQKDTAKKDSPAKPSEEKDKDGWMPLFNGKNLDGWKVTEFGGQGEAYVEDGAVVISQGADLSGIHTEKKLPKINYEIQYEAQRAAGSDFFAGLTFPVNESYCSLICGGWGGGVCGLSSLDGMDASENQTTSYREFEKGKWYKFRLVVSESKIQAWINDEEIVDVNPQDHKVSVRFEVEKSQPLGFCTWQTTGRIRNARIRTIPGASKPEPSGTKK